ncbi:sulfurtransferase [Mesorhizobium sp. LHD-90]|uniref:sulfurtransferase n=1 Tax=Mesorhizobium sp. LHD-90 TaxID=3071414 RepID=UPI0027E036AF|nr:sulfurtransferase [Mesorhizobium sp. LHD-90]MDQ6433194.1 sulfurtransferase [Mesorhizobium sp. LHD-90]
MEPLKARDSYLAHCLSHPLTKNMPPIGAADNKIPSFEAFSMTSFPFLVEPGELAHCLGKTGLIILDCSVDMKSNPNGRALVESDYGHWREAHIPGSHYRYLMEDFSSPRRAIGYGLPEPDQIAAVLSGLGWREGSVIVLYGRLSRWGNQSAVARIYWVLRACGVSNVMILNGGWEAWIEAGLPVTSTITLTPHPTEVTLHAVKDAIASLDEVRAALEKPDIQLVNALQRNQFEGTGGSYYGRPGRIPGSLSLPFAELIDPQSNRYLDPDKLEQLVTAAGIEPQKRTIIYCGAGLAASMAYFVLENLDHRRISVYDGSLLEWSSYPDLPLITDATG